MPSDTEIYLGIERLLLGDAKSIQSALQIYRKKFVQDRPRYGIKKIGRDWIIQRRRLPSSLVAEHLRGGVVIGSLGRWYPEYAIIDVDDPDISKAHEIRQYLQMNAANSMLLSSESSGHAHILFRPSYRAKPPTINLLHSCMESVVIAKGAELYPQKERIMRLPFSANHPCLDEGRELLDWPKLLYWFLKLEPYDIGFCSEMRNQNNKSCGNSSRIRKRHGERNTIFAEGKCYFDLGLSQPHTRNHAQFAVLCFLKNEDYSIERAIQTAFEWIRTGHNGFSREARNGQWKRIKNEIQRQAHSVWSKYDYERSIKPEPRLSDGWTTREDLIRICLASDGRINRARFLYQLLKYLRPRRLKNEEVPVHVERLIEFSSKSSYLDHLEWLDCSDLLKRSSEYLPGVQAKTIILDWHWVDGEPFLHEGVSYDSFDEAIRAAWPLDVLVKILREKNVDTRAINGIRRCYDKGAKKNRGTSD